MEKGFFKQIEQLLNKSERGETLLNAWKNQKNAMKRHLIIFYLPLQPKLTTNFIILTF